MESEDTSLVLSSGLPCYLCEIESTAVCRVCNRPFCILHQSDLDESVCANCPISTEAEASIAEQVLPLTSEGPDGKLVTHKGRDIYPVGAEYTTSAKAIGEMSNEELKEHVVKYRALLKQAELLTDFRRVQLSMASMEVMQREEIERRRLRGIRQSTTTQSIKIGGIDASKMGDKTWAAIAAKMKKAGITAEMIQAAIKAKTKN